MSNSFDFDMAQALRQRPWTGAAVSAGCNRVQLLCGVRQRLLCSCVGGTVVKRTFETIDTNQLGAVLYEVHQNHKWPLDGRKIKYVDFHYDNRDAKVFTIEFRHGGGDAPKTTFTAVNRIKPGTLDMEDVRLFEEVMSWLKEGRS